jgi:uncharacterized LabA/DUF88 family protein
VPKDLLAIFIDGGYLDKVAEHELRFWIDIAQFPHQVVRQVSQEWGEEVGLFRTYYYHCPPWQPPHPTEEEQNRYASRRKFFDFLRSLPQFEMREGVLRSRGTDHEGKPIFVQKRVDLMLGLDIAAHALRRDVRHVVLVSGDSDLIPAVERAKSEGLLVWLFHGTSYAMDLWESADRRVRLTPDWVPMRPRP